MSRGLRSRSLETKLYIEQDYRIGTAVKLNLTEADRRINITFNNVSCLQCAEASTLLYFTCLFPLVMYTIECLNILSSSTGKQLTLQVQLSV